MPTSSSANGALRPPAAPPRRGFPCGRTAWSRSLPPMARQSSPLRLSPPFACRTGSARFRGASAFPAAGCSRQQTMTASTRIVIVGAGQAGAQVAFSLRQDGFAGDIEMIGEEPGLPYQRPPLSKSVLLGKMSPERLHLRPAQWYASNNVRLHLSHKVSSIDRGRRRVRLDDASEIAFDHLVIATGARAASRATEEVGRGPDAPAAGLG